MNRYTRELSIAAALVLILAMLALFARSFYQAAPLLSLVARQAPSLLVTCGIAAILVARQIDISVGSQFALCSMAAGAVFIAHWPWAMALLALAGLGLVLGLFNGLLVTGLGLPSIVVTLATMISWREALRWRGQGRLLNLPPEVQWFGLPQTAGQLAVITASILIFGACAWAARYLPAGRLVYATGSNAEAARLAGLKPRRTTLCCFALVGILTGVAALLNTVQSPQVDPKSGTGLELQCIAAAIVGGVAVSGGRGNLVGAGLGLVLLACIGPALTHLHIQPYWERALQGAIILIAIVVERNYRTERG